MTNWKRIIYPTMKIEYFNDNEAMSSKAAALILEELRKKPDLLLCTASGDSPGRTYSTLVELCRNEMVDTSRLRLIKLDEWGGIPGDDPNSCESQLKEQLVGPLGITGGNFISFRGNSGNPAAEAERISRWLEANGPVDFCVLGLGLNGHIGFNEPAPVMSPRCHVTPLSTASMQHLMASRMHVKPTYGITMGMADILDSGRILLLVSGKGKAEIFGAMADGGISTAVPASFLHLHRDTTCMVDRTAIGEEQD